MRADVVSMSQEYLYGGGHAESFDLRDKHDWHQALYERILLADTEVRNKIRNDRNLRRRVEITPKKGGTEWGKCKNEPFL